MNSLESIWGLNLLELSMVMALVPKQTSIIVVRIMHPLGCMPKTNINGREENIQQGYEPISMSKDQNI